MLAVCFARDTRWFGLTDDGYCNALTKLNRPKVAYSTYPAHWAND